MFTGVSIFDDLLKEKYILFIERMSENKIIEILVKVKENLEAKFHLQFNYFMLGYYWSEVLIIESIIVSFSLWI